MIRLALILAWIEVCISSYMQIYQNVNTSTLIVQFDVTLAAGKYICSSYFDPAIRSSSVNPYYKISYQTFFSSHFPGDIEIFFLGSNQYIGGCDGCSGIWASKSIGHWPKAFYLTAAVDNHCYTSSQYIGLNAGFTAVCLGNSCGLNQNSPTSCVDSERFQGELALIGYSSSSDLSLDTNATDKSGGVVCRSANAPDPSYGDGDDDGKENDRDGTAALIYLTFLLIVFCGVMVDCLYKRYRAKQLEARRLDRLQGIQGGQEGYYYHDDDQDEGFEFSERRRLLLQPPVVTVAQPVLTSPIVYTPSYPHSPPPPYYYSQLPHQQPQQIQPQPQQPYLAYNPIYGQQSNNPKQLQLQQLPSYAPTICRPPVPLASPTSPPRLPENSRGSSSHSDQQQSTNEMIIIGRPV